MKSLNTLEQAIGNEYLMDPKQKKELVAKLTSNKKLSSSYSKKRPQPHTNKIVDFK